MVDADGESDEEDDVADDETGKETDDGGGVCDVRVRGDEDTPSDSSSALSPLSSFSPPRNHHFANRYNPYNINANNCASTSSNVGLSLPNHPNPLTGGSYTPFISIDNTVRLPGTTEPTIDIISGDRFANPPPPSDWCWRNISTIHVNAI